VTERGAPEPPGFPTVTAPARTGAEDAASATRGFLFADLRDYTRYVDARGDRAGAALLERYRSLVRGVVAAARGAEIRTEGDSFYVVFGSVSAAVRAGLAIVAAAAETAAGPGDPIRVGVGIHAGETIETAEGFVGSAVNLAARLCAEAKAGEVVVSDTVRGLTRTSLDVAFEPLGSRRLKGVAEPVACYRVVPREAAAVAAPAVRAGRRPSRLLAAGLAIALVAVVAVGAAALAGGQGAAPTPTPGPSAAALASPSAAASASPAAPAGGSSQPSSPTASPSPGPFPNEVEAAILAALPSTLAKTCVRGGTSDDARLAGFKGWYRAWDPPFSLTPASGGGVTCHPASGAARAYVMVPDTGGDEKGAATVWLGYLEAQYHLPYGSCATDNRAYESWTGSQGSGMLACMNPYDGRPWLYFTFNDGRYLGFATRDDSNYDALYAWWEQLKTFLP
jgi:class 3 adenylate cyclase